MSQTDKNDPDNFDDILLLDEVQYIGVNLLKLAYDGDCKKFMANTTVQNVIREIWNNNLIATPYKNLFYDQNGSKLISESKVNQAI
jgi:hypothetical protein